MTAAELPDAVAATTSQYLELIDKALPGQVLGQYLTGSVPQGDFHLGASDIDGVVVLATPLESPEPVRAVHAALPEKPAFDVTYLTAADLAAPPDPEKPVVFTLDGVFKEAPRGGPVGPVLWSEMAHNSLALRTAPGLVVHDDPQALRDHTRDNLTSYWAPLLDEIATHIETLADDHVLDDWIVPWCTLGVPRLHALLATNQFVSKTGAGQHAIATFPQWAPLCQRFLDHRAGTPQTFTVADANQSIALGRTAIADALLIP